MAHLKRRDCRYTPEFIRFLDEEILRLSKASKAKPEAPAPTQRFVQGNSISLDQDEPEPADQEYVDISFLSCSMLIYT
jgi:hypothetical protein